MLSYRNPSRQCCCCIVKWLAEKRAFCESHCVWVWNEWINPLIIKESQQERKQRNKGSRRNTVYIIIFSHAIKMDWKLNSYLCNAVYSVSYKVLSSIIERMHSCLVFFIKGVILVNQEGLDTDWAVLSSFLRKWRSLPSPRKLRNSAAVETPSFTKQLLLGVNLPRNYSLQY